jgi:hypothetical protein
MKAAGNINNITLEEIKSLKSKFQKIKEHL